MMIVKVAVEAYLDSLTIKDSTREKYKSVLNRFAAHLGFYRPIASVSPVEINEFFGKLGRSEETLRSYWKIINAFYTWLARHHPEDYKPPIMRWWLEYDAKKAITEEQLEKLLAAARSLRNELIIRFMADTGMDTVAVSLLKVKDVSGLQVQAWEHGHRQPMRISQTTREKFDLWLKRHPTYDYLFCDNQGNPLSAAAVRFILYWVAQKAEIGKLNVKGFWHRQAVIHREAFHEHNVTILEQIPGYLR